MPRGVPEPSIEGPPSSRSAALAIQHAATVLRLAATGCGKTVRADEEGRPCGVPKTCCGLIGEEEQERREAGWRRNAATQVPDRILADPRKGTGTTGSLFFPTDCRLAASPLLALCTPQAAAYASKRHVLCSLH